MPQTTFWQALSKQMSIALQNRLEADQLVGLSVSFTNSNSTHVGIAYQWRGKNFLYHQAFHYRTRLEPFDAEAAVIGGVLL